ncbi:sigma 54-interacting transcriptional regulator [Hymenobacter sp.]|uniref:sigma 54-interacting transcriptional regulator n=1 Tax=Hymenobacter sp. TaxID=1898978 RepID=UPI00286BDA1A|nr:sigma 54-interacting transcriptional regulator [Hymenobacter sp.]
MKKPSSSGTSTSAPPKALGKEQATLIGLSQVIATVRDKHDLLRLLVNNLRPVLGFYDCGLFVVDPDGQYHSDWTVLLPEVDPSAANVALQAAGLGRHPHPGSIIEANMQRAAEGAFIMDFRQEYERHPTYPFFPFALAHGFREALVALLQVGGKPIGVFYANTKKTSFFKATQLPFFQATADQIAVAVANILANEEILAREQEKTQLLAISEAIATVRGKEDLLRVIIATIKPLLPFHDCGILIVDKDRQRFYDLATIHPQIDGSPANQHLADAGFYRTGGLPYSGSSMEWLVAQLAATNGPLLFDFQADHSAFTDAELLRTIKELGHAEGLAALLKSGGEVCGCFMVNAMQRGQFKPEQSALFQNITDQLSVAVANILANEEILAREEEKTKLLEITELIAQVKATDDLLRLIVDKIKPLFRFHDCGLFVVSADGQTHTDLAAVLPDVSPSAWNTAIAAVSTNIPHSGSLVEWMMATMADANKPVLFDFQELVARFPDYPQLAGTGLLEMGYRDCLAVNLTVRGQLLGFFCINALQKDYFQSATFPLFRAIGHAVSIAVGNILAHEEIVAREREKATLLEITEELSRSTHRRDVLQVVYDHLRRLLPFDGSGLFVVNEAADFHQLLIHSDQAGGDPTYPIGTAAAMPYRGSAAEWMAQRVAATPLAELMRRFPDHPHYPDLQAAGIVVLLHGPLTSNGRVIGMFCLNARLANTYTQEHTRLFRHVTDQLSVAVANILANEELVEQTREMELLLSLSEDMATIRDREDLWRVMTAKIKPLIPFDDAVVALYTEGGKCCNHMLTVSPAERVGNANYAKVVNQNVPIAGTPYEYFLTKPKHHLFPIEELVPDYGDSPGVMLMLETDLRYTWHVKLNWAGKTIGFVHFHFARQESVNHVQHSLVNSIADQLAVAAANILANEEIVAREKEKAELLAISEQLATIRDEQQLFAMLFERLGPALRFDDAVLALYDEAGEQVCYLHHAEVAALDRQQSAAYRQLMGQPQPVAGTPFAEFAAYPAPRVVPLAEMQARYPAYPGVRVMEDFGLRESAVLPLRYGGQLLGVLLFHYREPGQFRESHIPFCRNLTDQVAVALANIRATNALAGQAREKALQVAVTEALHRTNTWDSRLLAVVRTLQDFVPFDFAAVGVHPAPVQGGVCNFRRVGFDEYQVLDAEALARIGGLPLDKLQALRRAALEQNAPGPARRLLGAEYVAFNRQHPFQALISRAFALESKLKAVVPLARGYFLFSFSSRQPDVYTAAHERLLDSLTGVFADTVEKLLAFDEIELLTERLELEKEYLEEEIQSTYDFTGIVGKAATLQEAFEQASRVAATDATVLLLGETGTGKELFARALHHASPRRNKLMVKLNCAALPAQLVESELFGHEKGAFTGALERRIGKFELADGGTLFLDEVGELPLEVQPKLLRALQEREFERLGSNKTIRVNVRLVAATNRNLEEEVAEGRFRADFYYRLHVFPLVLPPLRERDGDVDLLVRYFLQKFGARYGRPGRTFSAEALRQMRAYGWPGNVRELEHLVEQALLSNRPTDRELGLPRALAQAVRLAPASAEAPVQTWQDAERANILAALRQAGGRVRGPGGAAELLSINANTLDSRIAKLGIVKAYSALNN